MTTRDEIHAIIDTMPDERLDAARLALLDLAIPDDDEPLTTAELAALEHAEQSAKHGTLIPHEEVRRRLGRGS
jgi:predicted transcriptional regulator